MGLLFAAWCMERVDGNERGEYFTPEFFIGRAGWGSIPTSDDALHELVSRKGERSLEHQGRLRLSWLV